ncbi:heavy metal-associated isoprenylated plant protein 36-like [Prosopis cineraria]|uniref:heavy metal-associated isoprenylated plant protein 36-like n=1 Tax=Prosopis cineraria TaxID=364024 RepID=UPI00240F9293|nr:heavy metal-associated isoprenylated plant protein 36-like [Prosopis cineraria]
MATEVDLKVLKIELKVSANCCEGCEKKVKKALKGIEGILKTDIDPWRPKVTVLGNVDPQILIKRLLKVGKHAELDGFEELKASKKEAETIAVARGKEKEKHPDEYEHKTQKDEDIRGGGAIEARINIITMTLARLQMLLILLWI